MPAQPMAETINQMQLADYDDDVPTLKPNAKDRIQESPLIDAKKHENLKQRNHQVKILKLTNAKSALKLQVQQNMSKLRATNRHPRRRISVVMPERQSNLRRRKRSVARSASTAGKPFGISGRDDQVALDILVKMTPIISAFGRRVDGWEMGLRSGDVGGGIRDIEMLRGDNEEGDGVERVVQLLGETRIGGYGE